MTAIQPDPPLHTARAEVTLARDDAWPLRHVPLKPDPLQGLAASFAQIRIDQHETLEIIMDLVPLSRAAARRRGRRSAAALTAEREGDPTDWLAQLNATLWGPQQSKPKSTPRGVQRVEKTRQDTLLGAALVSPDPHFMFQFLIRARSENKQRAAALIQSTLSALDQFDGHNEFKVVGRRLGRGYSGSDRSTRARRFDRRIDGWRFKRNRSCTVSSSEILGLLKAPTKHCASQQVVRSGGTVPPPPRNLGAFDFARPDGQFFIGAVKKPGGGERYVAVPEADSYFSYNPGQSQFGKTQSALVRLIAMARGGEVATMFIDPHNDALADLKPYLVPVLDRVIELSVAPGSATGSQVAWNPFAKENLHGDNAISNQTTLITDSVGAALGWDKGGAPRATTILQMAIGSLLELSTQLPEDIAPTIFQIVTICTDEDWRNAIMSKLSKNHRNYWEHTYPNLPGEAAATVLNFLYKIRGIDTVAALLGSSRSSYDLRHAADNRKVVLVRLAGSGMSDKLIASLVVYDLMKAVMSRVDVPKNERVPIHTWMDEVQDYDGAVKGQIQAILEQTAKFGMRLHLLNQQPTSLQKATLAAALTNSSHVLTTAVSPESAKLLAPSLGSGLNPDAIVETAKYNFIGRVQVDGAKSRPFRYRGVSLEEAFGTPDQARIDPTTGQPVTDHQIAAAISANSGAKPIADTLAELATLDDRILAHVSGSRTRRPANPARAANRSTRRLPDSVIDPSADPTPGPNPTGGSDPNRGDDPDGGGVTTLYGPGHVRVLPRDRR